MPPYRAAATRVSKTTTQEDTMQTDIHTRPAAGGAARTRFSLVDAVAARPRVGEYAG